MFASGRVIALAMSAAAACTAWGSSLAADADIAGVPAYTSADAQPFDALPTASHEMLASLRGGLRAGGLDMEFAANVRTFVNGNLVLESFTNLTAGGKPATQSNMPNAGVDGQSLGFVSGLGGPQSNALPASLSGLAGQSGVVVGDSSGVTTALHSVTRQQILGVVLTTASNQHIRQEIDVEVTVSNFGRFQDVARGALFSSRLLGSLNQVP